MTEVAAENLLVTIFGIDRATAQSLIEVPAIAPIEVPAVVGAAI